MLNVAFDIPYVYSINLKRRTIGLVKVFDLRGIDQF